jgi:hypothetical protein
MKIICQKKVTKSGFTDPQNNSMPYKHRTGKKLEEENYRLFFSISTPGYS